MVVEDVVVLLFEDQGVDSVSSVDSASEENPGSEMRCYKWEKTSENLSWQEEFSSLKAIHSSPNSEEQLGETVTLNYAQTQVNMSILPVCPAWRRIGIYQLVVERPVPHQSLLTDQSERGH